MSKTWEELKDEFKKEILEYEQKQINMSTILDNQKATVDIVKLYEKISKEVEELQ